MSETKQERVRPKGKHRRNYRQNVYEELLFDSIDRVMYETEMLIDYLSLERIVMIIERRMFPRRSFHFHT